MKNEGFMYMLLTQPDTMSRFLYFLHTLGMGAAQIVIVILFALGRMPAPNAMDVLAVLSGGTFLGSIGRAATKLTAKAPAPPTTTN